MTWPEMIVAFSVPLWLVVEGIALALDRLPRAGHRWAVGDADPARSPALSRR
jgi:hypothetical protein